MTKMLICIFNQGNCIPVIQAIVGSDYCKASKSLTFLNVVVCNVEQPCIDMCESGFSLENEGEKNNSLESIKYLNLLSIYHSLKKYILLLQRSIKHRGKMSQCLEGV